ncbi:UDP-N-acetylmuramate--L-alanine ligase [Athalassotoga saccharophila]|uniref:UDP-N-acetylmuramate--L-alanine ligase n=1 Tax=Athalassotoga saccharophila TaxID=1441386 RepID=UPI001379992F|nr:cyanophycin synthetase [Athalassotoga saccharophila]BBJ27706.1 UDP-N-acetylmuramate--L-alanine ligase [Athalassotoga saccharophila]
MKIHFVGVGGMGLSALALWSKSHGHEVTGSDLSNGPMIKTLIESGIKVNIGSNDIIDSPDLVVVSSAVPYKDVQEFKQKGFRVMERMDFVISHINATVGVTGTDGKSSTTFMSQWIAMKNGIDASMICGAIPIGFDSTFRFGKDGVILEVDESDPKMEEISAQIGILTNLRYDHLDRYKNSAQLQLEKIMNFLKKSKYTVVPYDFDFSASIKVGPGEKISYEPLESTFDTQNFKVKYMNEEAFVSLPIAGVHQMSNATMAIAGGILLGIPLKDCAESLKDYPGLRRRLEIVRKDPLVIDDYAHTPDEIRAALISVRNYFKKVIAIFEPHRYTRFLKFRSQFAKVLSMADEIYVTEIFGAFEDQNGLDSKVLVEDLKASGKKAFFSKMDEVIDLLKKTDGDLYLFMGAGNITYKAHEFAKAIKW